MATDPNDIRLSPEQRQLLAQLADERGADWNELLDALIVMARLGIDEERFSLLRAQEISLAKIWDNEEDSVFDEM